MIYVGNGILNQLGKLIKGTFDDQGKRLGKVCLVSDEKVYSIYGKAIQEGLLAQGIEALSMVFPEGEETKNMASYNRLLNFLAENQLDRDGLIIALGGGVIGDLAGFTAATYKRGIEYVQVPTTILSAVDASVGGKTAINLESGKNLVGAFHQPLMVLCDTQSFETLDKRQWSNGFAEIIKYGLIAGNKLADFLDQYQPNVGNDHGTTPPMEDIVSLCVEIKKTFVEEDELDTGLRQVLNLGHTIGHAVEKASAYSLLHGEAVAIGIAKTSKYMARKGLMAGEQLQRILGWLTKWNLPTEYTQELENIYEAITLDKKRKGQTITMVLPYKIGYCRLEEVPIEKIKEIL